MSNNRTESVEEPSELWKSVYATIAYSLAITEISDSKLTTELSNATDAIIDLFQQANSQQEGMNAKGTPGPWKFNGKSQSGKNNFNVIGTVVGGKYKIARIPFEITESKKANEIYLKEAEADARLIASAPLLKKHLSIALEALREIAGLKDNWRIDNYTRAAKMGELAQSALNQITKKK